MNKTLISVCVPPPMRERGTKRCV